MQTIKIRRKRDVDISTLYFTLNGVAINITGYSILLSVKRKVSDSDTEALLEKTMTPSGPVDGIHQITLTDTETDFTSGQYFCDIDYINTLGEIKAITRFILIVEDQINKTIGV